MTRTKNRRRAMTIASRDFDAAAAGEDRIVVEENAREHTRLPGFIMIAASVATAASLVIGHVLSFLAEVDEQANDPDFAFPPIFGVGCSFTFLSPMLVFAFLGGRDLLHLRLRGLIVTGIVMCFVLSALCGLGVLRHLFMLTLAPGQNAATAVRIVLSSLMCTLNLLAGVLGSRALGQHDVQKYFALRIRALSRY